jgi:hypothetical protein
MCNNFNWAVKITINYINFQSNLYDYALNKNSNPTTLSKNSTAAAKSCSLVFPGHHAVAVHAVAQTCKIAHQASQMSRLMDILRYLMHALDPPESRWENKSSVLVSFIFSQGRNSIASYHRAL